MRLLLAAFALILTSGVVWTQTTPHPTHPYSLTLTGNQIQILWVAIQKAPLPRETTDEVVNEILRQVKEQEEARTKK